MENATMDTISGNLAEMRLIVEGAVSFFEKENCANSDFYSLIGEALYMMRERIIECLEACQNGV